MDRIVAANSVPLAQADVAPSTGTPEYATSGNAASGVPATTFPAYVWNMLQDEIMAIISAAGITPDDTNWAQVIASLRTLRQRKDGVYAGDTSSIANAIVAAYTPAITALQDGMELQVVVANANTGATTFDPGTGTPLPIIGPVGALQGGELPAGAVARLKYDSASSSWMLWGCTEGPQQIAPGTQSNHPMNIGQLQAYVPIVATGNITGSNTTTSTSASLTAPSDGILLGIGIQNNGAVDTSSHGFSMTLNGSAFGGADTTTLTKVETGTAAAVKGTAYTLGVAGTSSLSFSLYATLVFISTPGT